MELRRIYKCYPNNEDCIQLVEKAFWNEKPKCPYCGATNQTPIKSESRYHCNSCKTTFSVTVNTVFHKTRVDLQKWFLLLWFYFNDTENLPIRQIAAEVQVTKDTAWLMLKKVRQSSSIEKEILKKIISSI